jgi:NitT/TauT family transport system permease protein
MVGSSSAASKASTPRLPVVRGLGLFVSASWGTVALLVLWLMATRLNWLSPRVVPDPVAVLNALGADLMSGSFWTAIGVTVLTSLIGLALGSVAGGLAAFILSDRSFRWLYVFLRPYFMFLNSTPRIVLVPFFILIFGIGPSSRIALGFSLVFFVMFFGVFGAVEAVRPEYLRSAYIMGASRLAMWRAVLFPGTLPGVVDSLRISVSLALLGVVVAEIISTPSGIGGLLRVRGDQYDLPGVFSALIVLGALSAGAMASLAAFERRVFRWK